MYLWFSITQGIWCPPVFSSYNLYCNHLGIDPKIKTDTKINKNVTKLEIETFDCKMEVLKNRESWKKEKEMSLIQQRYDKGRNESAKKN